MEDDVKKLALFALREMLKAYEQMLGLKQITDQDHENINNAPIVARKAIAALEEGK